MVFQCNPCVSNSSVCFGHPSSAVDPPTTVSPSDYYVGLNTGLDDTHSGQEDVESQVVHQQPRRFHSRQRMSLIALTLLCVMESVLILVWVRNPDESTEVWLVFLQPARQADNYGFQFPVEIVTFCCSIERLGGEVIRGIHLLNRCSCSSHRRTRFQPRKFPFFLLLFNTVRESSVSGTMVKRGNIEALLYSPCFLR